MKKILLGLLLQRKCKNPNYTLQCEFLLYKDIIYYDKNGIVYEKLKCEKLVCF